jgi:hypothetical protein
MAPSSEDFRAKFCTDSSFHHTISHFARNIIRREVKIMKFHLCKFLLFALTSPLV